MSKEKKRQLAIWERRVFYPEEKFKENTKADLTILDDIIQKSKENFVTIISSSESCVYKIGRYFIEQSIDNESIAFQDGDIFDMYIDVNLKYDSEIRKLCNDLMDVLGKDIKGKWVIIPELNCQWSKKFATYFITNLKNIGCRGILFYSDKDMPDTLAQILCEETYEKTYQFPEENFKKKKTRRKIATDEY